MSELVGKSFRKYCEHRGIETCHVLAHNKKQGTYTVAFIQNSPKPGTSPATGVGKIVGDIAHVRDWVVESYATDDQKKLKALLKLETKARKLQQEILSESATDFNQRSAKHHTRPADDPSEVPF